MKILKVAVGNSSEAFIENGFTDGLNIISSDDNNKGKTIVIQSMMYALGNEPAFPTSFEYQKYYYYIEFEEKGNFYKLCRSNAGFVLRQANSLFIFDNVAELKRYWNKHIFPLPSIIKNQVFRIVDPVLFVQLFFVGQDKKDTSNIAHHGFYNKQDFLEMLYSFAGYGIEQLSQEKIEDIKERISVLIDERKVLSKQHKILQSTKTPVTYLSAESDRLAFKEKVVNLEKVQAKIAEFRKQRNIATTQKNKWEFTINELRSLNRAISCGELRCMDCNSKNIILTTGESRNKTYSFDVSTVEMRNEIIASIEEKINSYKEEIEMLSSEIEAEQKKLQTLMEDDNISLESIVSYKREIFSAANAEEKIKELDKEIMFLKNKLISNDKASKDLLIHREDMLKEILYKMNKLRHQIDPDGNIEYKSLFTQRDEVYSGSEATIYHLVKLLSLKFVIGHNYPIVIDSFRAEDLSTNKEKIVLNIAKSINNQIIFTTTLKNEELGKYDACEGINHIDYISHTPSKILDSQYVNNFIELLTSLSIKL